MTLPDATYKWLGHQTPVRDRRAQARPFAELLDDWLRIATLGFDYAWLIGELR